ncbi:MAG: alpha/beta fold hydrolase [Novosphingobium sp.]
MTQAFAVPVEGGILQGEARGESPALCFIHGMAGDRHDWQSLIAQLPPGLPLLTYDLRGFGDSTATEGVAFSHAADLLTLLDARGIERASLVGLSMGGGVALNFALSHPDRVERLVLISPAMVGWEWSDEWKAIWRGVAQAARAGDLPLARELWLAHPMFAAVLETPAGDELRRSVANYHGRQWIKDDQRPEVPDIERLHLLRVPTLLLAGQRDAADMRLIADVLASAAPDVKRVDFPAGHMLHLECPAEVARAIGQF